MFVYREQFPQLMPGLPAFTPCARGGRPLYCPAEGQTGAAAKIPFAVRRRSAPWEESAAGQNRLWQPSRPLQILKIGANHIIVKKCKWLLCLLAVVLSLGLGQTAQAYERAVAVTVDGVALSPAPFAADGVTYAPMVALLEAMGGWETTWDRVTRTATSETDRFTLAVPVGQRYVTADGHRHAMNAPSLIRNGRTYVPLRAVAELLGAEVTFTSWSAPVTVTTGRDAGYSQEDLYWLSRIISAESQGEPLAGQIAVGNVVLNRVAHSDFPSTVKDVIFDTKHGVQFTPVANGAIYWEPTAQSVEAARMAMEGVNTVGKSLYFFNPSLSQGTWIVQNRTYHSTIGNHRFYL